MKIFEGRSCSNNFGMTQYLNASVNYINVQWLRIIDFVDRTLSDGFEHFKQDRWLNGIVCFHHLPSRNLVPVLSTPGSSEMHLDSDRMSLRSTSPSKRRESPVSFVRMGNVFIESIEQVRFRILEPRLLGFRGSRRALSWMPCLIELVEGA
jgi:hypothetical protein